MLDRIRILAQVVESGSFSRAARALNQAPSSVTRAIDALEQQLGIPLFKRSTRQLVLTEQGAYFLARSLPLLEEADQLVQSLQPLSVAPEGPLRVSVFESFGASWLSPRLPDFLARYPGVRLEVALDNRMVDLDAENVDVAVRIGELPDSSLQAVRVGRVRRVLVAAPAYLKAQGVPQRPEDLARHAIVSASGVTPVSEWRFNDAGKPLLQRMQPRMRTTTNDSAIAAAVAGLGVTRLLSYQVASHVRSGALQVLLEDFEPAPLPVHVVHHEGRRATQKVRAFIDLAVDMLREDPALR